MTHVLHLDSSARPGPGAGSGGSASRALSAALVDELRAREPGLTTTYRDVAADPVPLITADWVEAAFGFSSDRSPLAVAEQLVAELEAADVLVLGVPVYNFGVPAAFKAWVDQVVLLGRTFRWEGAQPVGLLAGRSAVVLRPSATAPDLLRSAGWDLHEPWLRTVLGYVGITDVELVPCWGLFDPDAAAHSRDVARAGLGAVADRLLATVRGRTPSRETAPSPVRGDTLPARPPVPA